MKVHPHPSASSIAKLIACALFALSMLAGCGEDKKPAPVDTPLPKVGAPSETPGPSTAAPVQPKPPAGIGTVHSMEGDVRISSAGSERRAQVGTALQQGDVVRVPMDAWALLAMSDGATITMRPETELRFDDYRYDPDGEPQQNSATLSLVQGALRSITGLIAQTNRPGYQIRTQTATIGVRGTDHEPAYYPPPPPGQKAQHEPGTYDKVNDGETVIRRGPREVPVRRGQTAFAHQDVKQAPRVLPKPPVFYERHAQVDLRAVERRVEFQRQFAQQQERRTLERQQRQDAQKKADEERRKKDQDARKKEQEARKDKREQEQKKREDEQKQRRAEQDKKRQASEKKREDEQKKRQDEQKKKQEQRLDEQKKKQEPRQQEERAREAQREQKAAQQRQQRDTERLQQQQQRDTQRQQQQQQRDAQRLQQQQQQQQRQREQQQQRGRDRDQR